MEVSPREDLENLETLEVETDLILEEDHLAVESVARVIGEPDNLGNEVNGAIPDSPKQPVSSPKTQMRAAPTKRKTPKTESDDLLHQYLVDIGQHPLLTKKDEFELGTLIENGLEAADKLAMLSNSRPTKQREELQRAVLEGKNAEKQFANSNLRLVVSIAKRYQASTLPLLDLIQEGNLGLIHAVEKFDHHKGFKFSTYATWWIRQAITRGIANTERTIRLPVHAADFAKRVDKERLDLYIKLGREPRVEEIAARLEESPEKVITTLRFARDPVSLNTPIGEEGEMELGDVVYDRTSPDVYEQVHANLLPQKVEEMLEELDERERVVLRRRYGLDDGEIRTLDEVGEEFGVTRERIRQIEAKAFDKLRHPANMGKYRNLTTP